MTAYDCSSASLQTKTIDICVGDINDHVPWFQPESLTMKFCPDMPLETLIGTLRGRDEDIGIYSELRYQFVYRKPFGIQMIVTRMDDRQSWKILAVLRYLVKIGQK